MNTFTLNQFQRSTGSAAMNASGAMLEGIRLTMDFYQWLLPHAVRFGWESLDTAMAVGRSSTIAGGI